MDKNEVRQLIMNRRHELSDEDIEMQSGLIIDRLKKSDIYKTSENVFLYMSYNREVDTYMLLSQCFMDGKKVYAPKVLSKTQMEFYCLSDENDLVSGYNNNIIFHISEFHIRMKPVFWLLCIKINKACAFIHFFK
jgi:5-formyltetrahydrofolate cyclo-ligase